jgi:methylase of polypeptide subunit release factors
MAFVGGDDGLDYYRIMFAQLAEMSRPPTLTMFLEMMTRQAEKLEQEYAGQLTFTFVKTFHCNIRIVEARFA